MYKIYVSSKLFETTKSTLYKNASIVYNCDILSKIYKYNIFRIYCNIQYILIIFESISRCVSDDLLRSLLNRTDITIILYEYEYEKYIA